MAKKKTGQIGASVAKAHASAEPSSYSSRFTFDPETNQIVAKSLGTDAPAVLAHAKINGTQIELPELAIGAHVNAMDTSASYDNEYVALWEEMDILDKRYKMRRAMRYIDEDPLCYTCVKMMADLANSTLTTSCSNEDFAEIIEMWKETAMPHSFRQSWFFEYFRSAMVPTLKTLIPYIPRDYKSNKIPSTGERGNIEGDKSLASEQAREEKTMTLVEQNKKAMEVYKQASASLRQAEEQFANKLCSAERLNKIRERAIAAQYQWLKGMIPGGYTVLNPMEVEIDGPRDMPLLRQPFLNVNGELSTAITSPMPQNQTLLQCLPMEIVEQVRAGQARIWLSPNICNITFGDKQPWDLYPTPIIWHARKALDMKRELEEMDRITARTVKNRILLVKLGTDQFPEFDPKKIEAVKQMFTGGPRTMTLVWNHCIELEWVEPKVDSLKDTAKYAHWNSEVRTAFGISPVLTGTSDGSGSLSDGILSFKGMEQRIREAQKKFLEFFMREVRMLRAALGISAEIEAKFDETGFKDEVKFWSVLTQAVMNGLIDQQTAIETLGFHFPTVLARMKKMKSLKAQGLFMPIPSANNLGPNGQMLPKGGGTATGGRPANAPKKESGSKGKPKPKAKAIAKIVPMGTGKVGVIVAEEDLTVERRKDVAEFFNIPEDCVMTKASYERDYGKVSLNPPWKDLDPIETIGALKRAENLRAEVNSEFEKSVAAFKATNKGSGGKRSAYVTEQHREEMHANATATVLAKYQEQNMKGVDADDFSLYFEQTKAALTVGENDNLTIASTALAICEARWKKTMSK